MSLTTAATVAVMTVLVGLTMIARSWAPAPAGRHRNPGLLPPVEDLIGPPSNYTAVVDPWADTVTFCVETDGVGWCEHCQATTDGTVGLNGFKCNTCGLRAGGAR